MKKRIILLISMIFMMFSLSACTTEETKQVIDERIDVAKQEIADQIGESVQKTIDDQMDSIAYSIESKLDPELGKIRSNMANIKATALVYYKINETFPDLQTIQTFFKDNFSKMQIAYKLSEDKLKVTIEYIGDKYNKEKVQDIIIDKKPSE